MKNCVWIVFILLLSTVCPAVELIVNGTFTDNANGWSWANIDGNGGWRNTGNPGGGFIINEGGAVGSDPTLWQNISGLLVGVQYTISGDYMTAHGGYQDNAFGVEIAGNLWQYSLNFTGWRHFSQTFIATSTSLTLTLTGERNGTDSDPMVDNISLTTSVPEMQSFWLLLGVVTIALRYRKS